LDKVAFTLDGLLALKGLIIALFIQSANERLSIVYHVVTVVAIAHLLFMNKAMGVEILLTNSVLISELNLRLEFLIN